jgi:hypothetical protein
MTRRTTLIVVSLLGLMVLVVTFAPPRDPVQNEAQSTPTPAATTGTDLSDPDAFDITETLSAAPGTPVRTIEAELGDRVQIVVEGSQPDAVQLGEISTQAVEAGDPARFELLAETPDAYPLVLVNEGRRIGILEIR